MSYLAATFTTGSLLNNHLVHSARHGISTHLPPRKRKGERVRYFCPLLHFKIADFEEKQYPRLCCPGICAQLLGFYSKNGLFLGKPTSCDPCLFFLAFSKPVKINILLILFWFIESLARSYCKSGRRWQSVSLNWIKDDKRMFTETLRLQTRNQNIYSTTKCFEYFFSFFV